MYQNQMFDFAAAQRGQAPNFIGLAGIAAQRDSLQVQAQACRNVPEPTVIMIMRSEVREWLKDWDK